MSLHRKFLLFSGLIIFFFTFALGELYAQNSWRYRFLVPSAESGSIQKGTSTSTDAPTTTGFSQHLVFTSRFGVGYSRLMTEGNAGGNSHTLKSDALDISYTWGEDFSIALGAGLVVGGQGDTSNTGVPYNTGEVRGGSVFSIVGVPMGLFEILVGVRKSEVQFKNYRGYSSGVAQKLADDVQSNSQHLSFGLGLVF